MINKIEDLIGKTMSSVKEDDNEIHFVASDGSKYRLYHSQDCCESVIVEDIIGDLNDLVGYPILMAEEATNSEEHPADLKDKPEIDTTFTWTFYKFGTVKGYVTIRFFGTSNGYYSESVDFVETK